MTVKKSDAREKFHKERIAIKQRHEQRETEAIERFMKEIAPAMDNLAHAGLEIMRGFDREMTLVMQRYAQETGDHDLESRSRPVV